MHIEELSIKEYKDFTKKNNAHFLQSYEWGLVSEKRGLKPYYVGLKDKKKIVATALLLKKSLPFGYSYFYIPRSYTINYNDYDLLKTFTLEIKKFCKKHKAIFFKIDPDIKLHTIDKDANKIDGENNYELVKQLKKIGFKNKKLTKKFETSQPRYTFRIDLKDSIEEIENRYTSTTIQRIKKAKNNEVTVEIGTIDNIKDFSDLMKLTEKRQDFYSHNKDFYEYFYEIFSKNNYVKLYLGKINIEKLLNKLNTDLTKLNIEFDEIKNLDSKKINNRKKEIQKNIDSIENQIKLLKEKNKKTVIASSYLTVTYGNKSWALYAANDMEYKNFYANYLIYEKQIRDAKNNGIEIFDVFGTIGNPNDNSNLVGLHDFKKKWGGEYTEFIGEFDYIINPVLYYMYVYIIPIRHKIVNRKLKRSGN